MDPINVIAAVDIGTSRISAAISSYQETRSRVNICESKSSVSVGVKRGIIEDEARVTEIIRTLLSSLEETYNAHIVTVYIGIGGMNVHSYTYMAEHNILSQMTISKLDIDKLHEKCNYASVNPGETILHKIPQAYSVDNQPEVSDPIGLSGTCLRCQYTMLVVDSSVIQSATQCVKKAGYESVKPIVSMLGTSRILTPEERKRGVALIDFGYNTMSVAIYVQGYLRQLSVVPLGSHTITSDLAIGCRIGINQAESIKQKFGNAKVNINKTEVFDLRTAEGNSVLVSQRQIDYIIQARTEELIDYAEAEIRKACNPDYIGAGIVLTGGGSGLANIRELIELRTGLRVRVAEPEISTTATVLGLVKICVESKQRESRKATQGQLFDNDAKPIEEKPVQSTEDTDEKKKPKKSAMKSFISGFNNIANNFLGEKDSELK